MDLDVLINMNKDGVTSYYYVDYDSGKISKRYLSCEGYPDYSKVELKMSKGKVDNNIIVFSASKNVCWHVDVDKDMNIVGLNVDKLEDNIAPELPRWSVAYASNFAAIHRFANSIISCLTGNMYVAYNTPERYPELLDWIFKNPLFPHLYGSYITSGDPDLEPRVFADVGKVVQSLDCLTICQRNPR